MELEDDVLFADLSRRIALLITDDDDNGKDLPVCFPSVSLQLLSHPMTMPSPFVYEPTTHYDPTKCRRECKGTGVFIPRSSMPRKKNKPGRFASLNTNKSYKPPEKSRESHLFSNLDSPSNYYNTRKSVRETNTSKSVRET